MLALADANGEVQASLPGLAHLAHVSITDTEAALDKFMGPDPYSRSQESEGRRLEEIDGGWRLINHEKYRFKLSVDDQRERARERQRRHREKCHGENVTECDTCDKSRMSLQKEKETEKEIEKVKPKDVCAEPDGPTQPVDPIVVEFTLNTRAKHPIRETQVIEWERLFPAVDVRQQLRSMVAWSDANPSRRKTTQGIRAFIVRWLSKEQDQRPVTAQRRTHPDEGIVRRDEAGERARAGESIRKLREFIQAIESEGGTVKGAAPAWANILAELKKEVPEISFTTWLKDLRPLAITRDKHLVLRSINDDVAAHVLDKFGDRILAIAEEKDLAILGVVIRDIEVQPTSHVLL